MSDLVAKKNRPPWLLAIILLVLTISIFFFGNYFYMIQVNQTRNIYEHQLTTLAELKSSQIDFWRSELFLDAEKIQTDPGILRNVESLIKNPGNISLYQQNYEWMNNQLQNPNYSSAFLINDQGKVVVRASGTSEKVDVAAIEVAIDSFVTNQITITDLFEDEDGSIHMDIVIPLINQSDEKKSIFAVVILQIDPNVILFPMIQSWPSTYETAETLLVRQEGKEVVYLNSLRFSDNSPLTFRFPLSQTNIPAVKAVQGVTGIVEGTDYRSVSVVASIIPITGTDWKLIAKIDQEEIDGSLRIELWNIVLTLLFLLLAMGLSLDVLWRRQSSSYYKGLFQTEVARRSLEEKYLTLFNQANDSILLVEENGKIVEANDQAVNMYGYSRTELLSLSISDLRAEISRSQFKGDMDLVKKGVTNFFETTHQKKGGESFLVEVSSRYLLVEGKGFYQSLIRDVTQRKKAEDQLRRSELDLLKAQQVSHVGSWFMDFPAKKMGGSEEMFRIFGRVNESSSPDFYENLKTMVSPEEYVRIGKILGDSTKKKQLFSFETQITRPDGVKRDIWVEAGEIILNDKGNIQSVSGIVQDITEKKDAERELRKSEILLQRIFDLLPVGLWITDRNGSVLRSNTSAKEILGSDILVGEKGNEIVHGRRLPSGETIRPEDWAVVHTINEKATIRGELIEIDAFDGKTKTVLNYSTPIIDENGDLEGSIIVNLDISELKKAEEQLSSQLDELRRWNLATLGRENRIRELKAEINELLVKQGLQPKYQSVKGDNHE